MIGDSNSPGRDHRGRDSSRPQRQVVCPVTFESVHTIIHFSSRKTSGRFSEGQWEMLRRTGEFDPEKEVHLRESISYPFSPSSAVKRTFKIPSPRISRRNRPEIPVIKRAFSELSIGLYSRILLAVNFQILPIPVFFCPLPGRSPRPGNWRRGAGWRSFRAASSKCFGGGIRILAQS